MPNEQTTIKYKEPKEVNGVLEFKIAIPQKKIDPSKKNEFKNFLLGEIDEQGLQWITVKETTQSFFEYLKSYIENEYDEDKTWNENLDVLYHQWDKINIDKKNNKLLGDLGEVLFIKYCIKNKIDWVNAYQKSSNNYDEKFDFVFDRKYFIDVKTTTKTKQELIIDFQQLPCFNEKKDIKFVTILLNKISKGRNICQIIKEDIGLGKSEHLDETYKTWESSGNLNEFTIFEDDYEIHLVNPNIIPKLVYEKKGNSKSGKVIITISSDNSLLSIDKLKIK